MNETQLLVLTSQIKNETIDEANTALRVGTALEEIVKGSVNKEGVNLTSNFSLKEEVQTDVNRFVALKMDNGGLYLQYLNGNTVLGQLAFVPIDETNTQIYPAGAVKIGYLNGVPDLGNLVDAEFIAKRHLFKESAPVTGINPALTFASADLLKSYNVVKNLDIEATSTTATITIQDDSVGLGQVLSCYVSNLSASSVAITIACVDDIKYPQNLDTGVSRSGDVITISANKEYLITFLRSKTGAWSFNILEQND